MTTPDRSPPRAQRPAAGARILAGGISIAAGLGLIGAMGISARTPPAAGPQIVRVVVSPSPATENATVNSEVPLSPSLTLPPRAEPPPVELEQPTAPPTTVSQAS